MEKLYIKDIIAHLEQRYPAALALTEDQEKIGLAVGDSSLVVNNILLALDVTNEVVDEALALNANFIITHHPFIYNPIVKLLFNDQKTKLIYRLLKENISTFSLHTNLDVAKDGVNDTLAKLIGLDNICGEATQGSFLRSGNIKKTSLLNFANHLKTVFVLKGLRIVGALERDISTVAIVGGSGADINNIQLALLRNCDCLITSEVKLHIAQYAQSQNLALIEVNHGVEHFVLEALRSDLAAKFAQKTKIYVSRVNTDPLISI